MPRPLYSFNITCARGNFPLYEDLFHLQQPPPGNKTSPCGSCIRTRVDVFGCGMYGSCNSLPIGEEKPRGHQRRCSFSSLSIRGEARSHRQEATLSWNLKWSNG